MLLRYVITDITSFIDFLGKSERQERNTGICSNAKRGACADESFRHQVSSEVVHASASGVQCRAGCMRFLLV